MSQEPKNTPTDTLFGQIALQLGKINREQLRQALEVQRRGATHRPLGEVLMELDVLREPDVDQILVQQRRLAPVEPGKYRTLKEDDLFGRIAMRMKFCTKEQLQEALNFQERLSKDKFMRLGDIMTLKGYLKKEQVSKIISIQHGLLVYCPTCSTEFNVLMFKPGSSLMCYRCGSGVTVPIRKTSKDMEEDLFFDSAG